MNTNKQKYPFRRAYSKYVITEAIDKATDKILPIVSGLSPNDIESLLSNIKYKVYEDSVLHIDHIPASITVEEELVKSRLLPAKKGDLGAQYFTLSELKIKLQESEGLVISAKKLQDALVDLGFGAPFAKKFGGDEKIIRVYAVKVIPAANSVDREIWKNL